jgi:LPXTG-site transpeptidase (sortase) family protein
MSLRRFNNILSLVIVALALYIFFLPVLPEASWWIKHSAPIVSHPVITKLSTTHVVTKDNRLVIPAMDLDQPIYEGRSVYTVNKGVWIRPNASTPDKGSNTVMVGHRLTYSNPRGVFYYLDKLHIGDPIEVDWHGTAYRYKTISVSIADPQDSSVEARSDADKLTLYTCAPLWSLKDRLVVVAERIN